MIHKYFLNSFYIAIDVNSGAVHILDEICFKILDLINAPLDEKCPNSVIRNLKGKYNEIDIKTAYNELFLLYDEGILFSEEEIIENFEKYTENAPIKAMCLHIAHDCNLRCDYCFAEKGDFGTGRKLMPFEVGKAAIDFIIKHSKNRKNIEIDFFGGEPLMNFTVVKQITEYAREKEKATNKNFRFTITTNGLMLNSEIIDFINKEMSNVVLSLDGRKEVNDRVRRKVDNSGCYDKIVPLFKELVEKREHNNYYIRGTFTKYNLDFSKDVLDIADNGFLQTSVEPVVCEKSLPYAINEDDLEKIFSEYEKLAKIIIEKKKNGESFNFFHFMLDLEQGPCLIKRIKGCGCGNEYIAVTPEGDIYPCHQFVGMEEQKMGSVLKDEINEEKKKYYSNITVLSKEDCKNCWAKYYCSGGCCANNYNYNKDVNKPYKISCELQKKRLECAIMIKAALC